VQYQIFQYFLKKYFSIALKKFLQGIQIRAYLIRFRVHLQWPKVPFAVSFDSTSMHFTQAVESSALCYVKSLS